MQLNIFLQLADSNQILSGYPMQEDLLSSEEINTVLEEAQHPNFTLSNFISLGSRKTSVFMVSIPTGLILVYGNQDTGMVHIRERHQHGRQEWKDSNRLDQASQFRLNVAPIEYMALAESIYKPQNLTQSKQPDLFDVYEGSHIHFDGKEIAYRLVTYKGTGIIHTLHPTKKANNKKTKLDLKQGASGHSWDLKSGCETFCISYYDSSQKELFKIIVRSIKGSSFEKWYVQVNEAPHRLALTTEVAAIDSDHNPEYRLLRTIGLHLEDLSWIESKIKMMLNNTYEYIDTERLSKAIRALKQQPS